jgi:hypothetical protein
MAVFCDVASCRRKFTDVASLIAAGIYETSINFYQIPWRSNPEGNRPQSMQVFEKVPHSCMGYEVITALMPSAVCVVTPFVRDISEERIAFICPEDGGDIFLRNFGNHIQGYTAPYIRRSHSTISLPWKH